jgi:hypothetical protein
MYEHPINLAGLPLTESSSLTLELFSMLSQELTPASIACSSGECGKETSRKHISIKEFD